MLSKNVSCRKKKTKNQTDFTINKNLKNEKKLKAKNNLLMQQFNSKTTTPRNQGSKNKSHTLKLMILLSLSSLGRRRIPTS
jgi:hypothetical protein